MKKILLIIIFTYSLLFSKEVTLQLPWKYQFQFAGYIIAKEKGFYKDIGLNVKLKEFDSTIDVIKELDENKIEYTVTRPTSMIDISKGKNLKYLATIFQSSPLVLLTDKSLNISSLSDLKNKRIMTSGDLSTDVSLLSMMFSQGIKLEDLVIQETSFNTKDLIDKKTDLIVSYISNEPFVLKELGGNPIIFNPKDYGFDFYSDILTTSKKYLQNNGNEVKKFREASLKGWEYAFSNINESVEILYNKYNPQNKSKEALIYEANELKKLAYHNTNELGKIEIDKLEKIYNVYKLLGLAKNNINFSEIIYDDLNIEFNLTGEEKSYLINKQPIKMCISADWTPFEKLDKDNKYIGLGADYYSIIEKNLSTKFELIKTKTPSEALNFIKDDKCDFLSLAVRTPRMERELNLSSTIFKIPLVIATKLNVPFVNKLEDLKNQKIAVPRKYINIDFFKNKYSNLNIIEVEDVQEGLKLLKEGKIDFLVSYASKHEMNQGKADSLSSVRIGETEIIPVYAKNAIKNKRYDLNQHFPLLTYSKNAYLRNLVDQVIQANNLDCHILYETDNAENLKQLVLQGVGVAWLPSITIMDELAQNKLIELSASKYAVNQSIFIYKSKLNNNPLTQFVFEHFKRLKK